MRTLADRVRRTLRKHELTRPDSRVVIALSGGPDSVALAYVMKELAESGMFTLVGLAHLNHRLRDTAARDEAFCRECAVRLGLAIEVASADVRALAASRRTSVEGAGREARYAFLERAADRLGADRIAVGHTRDDQAETYLLRALRGAGPRGLGGIHPTVGRIIRPFIETARREVIEYLAARGLTYCDDETNRDLTNPRNRIRHELLPYLRRHFSPEVVAVLAREAAIARDDAEWLDRSAMEAETACLLAGRDGLELDARAVHALHPAVARRVIRRALLRAAADRFVSFDHVDAVLNLARPHARGGVDLPGRRADRRGDLIVLAATSGRSAPAAPVRGLAQALPLPGDAVLPELGWVISAERGVADDWALSRLSARGLEVAIDADRVVEPLSVRTRRPGDTVHPLGLGGRKKLQDLFVDRKIDRVDRDRVPLVVDASDRILWIVGLTIEEAVRVPSPGRAVIFLKGKRLGGQG